jgi:YlmC/YmxH family sporulation protein
VDTSFRELKKKETINLLDGKRLGKVCDVVFTFPEGRVQGIVVPGGTGFRWGKGDLFIEFKQIKKIGIDTVLVEVKCAPKAEKKKEKWEDCPPPPRNSCPPQNVPPRGGYDRRDYGEYE